MARVSSSMACLNSLLASLRISRSSVMSSLVFAMSFSSCRMDASSSPFLSPMRSSASPDFFISCARSAMSLAFLFSARSHLSLCAMSSASSSRRTVIMLSMEVMTLSKWPPLWTEDAILAMFRLWDLPARILSLLKTVLRMVTVALSAATFLESWTKVVVALVKVALASSLLMISIALPMPMSSSVRRRERSDQSLALSLQVDLVASKNSSSALSCCLVSSRSVSSVASCLLLRAWSSSWVSRVASRVACSALLVAISSS
mmetsp:Transcript_69154/g.202971  ORF Transcript_69154/g.202971 Transcript_69154/m.202971 type:complete len:260 (+) Transcript_69154:379-1158(+)